MMFSHSLEDELWDDFPGWIIYIIVTGSSGCMRFGNVVNVFGSICLSKCSIVHAASSSSAREDVGHIDSEGS